MSLYNFLKNIKVTCTLPTTYKTLILSNAVRCANGRVIVCREEIVNHEKKHLHNHHCLRYNVLCCLRKFANGR